MYGIEFADERDKPLRVKAAFKAAAQLKPCSGFHFYSLPKV